MLQTRSQFCVFFNLILFKFSSMPGIIQVSVLDFEGPPSSSSSPISIKVSMGKREYQISDNGDFSFPLTTFRDDLIVTLQDADGNEISHTGVVTRLVVEKGLWNDVFPLEGGGHVRMKLQFVLSDEERNRVRLMRESVLKRKQEELINSDPIRLKSAASFNIEVSDSQKRLLPLDMVSTKEAANQAGLVSNPVNFVKDEKVNENISGTQSDQMPTSPRESGLKKKHDDLPKIRSSESAATLDRPDHKVSDSQRILPPIEAISKKEEATEAGLLSQPVNFSEDEIFEAKNIEGALTKQIQKTPNDTDRSEETSSTDLVPQEVGVHLTDVRYGDSGAAETEAQASPAEVPGRDTSSEVGSPLLGFSGSVVAEVKNTLSAKLEPDGAANLEKQRPRKKTPSNVRKMISAFEGSRAQEVKPFVEPKPTKSQPKKIGTEAKSGNKSTQSSSESIVSSFPTRKMQQAPTYIKQREEQFGSIRALGGAKLPEMKESSATDSQTEGKPSSLKKKFEGGDQPHKFSYSKTDSGGNIVIEESQRADTKELREDDNRGTSGRNIVIDEIQRGDTKEFQEVDSPSTSGREIVIEESRKGDTNELQELENQGSANNNLNTTAYWEEKFYDFERSGAWIFYNEPTPFCVTTSSRQVRNLIDSCKTEGRNSYSAPESREQVNEGDKTTDNSKPELLNSADAETPKGPVDQAIKVAIMICFGTLVILTRQRKNRKH